MAAVVISLDHGNSLSDVLVGDEATGRSDSAGKVCARLRAVQPVQQTGNERQKERGVDAIDASGVVHIAARLGEGGRPPELLSIAVWSPRCAPVAVPGGVSDMSDPQKKARWASPSQLDRPVALRINSTTAGGREVYTNSTCCAPRL